jgi:hypothetical protein
MFKYLLLSIQLKTIFILLISGHTVFAQIQSAISPSFQYFQQQSAQNHKQNAPSHQPQLQPPIFNQYAPPMGATADDIHGMVEQNAMRQMGAPAPQVPPNDPALAAAYAREQAAMVNQSKQHRQAQELKAILSEDLPPPATSNIPPALNYYANTIRYRDALSELVQMKNGSIPFSIRRAVYLVENAYKG